MTEKQKKFCKEYFFDYNATQAAIRAGYSKKTANRIASENLSKPDIQKYIRELQSDEREHAEIKRHDIIEQLKAIGFVDLESERIKASDKIKALELMARMLGLDKPEDKNDAGIIEKLIKGLKQA